jgi:hypothetical protein
VDHEAAARELITVRGVPFGGDRARVLEALVASVLTGRRPSLSAAAKSAGVPPGTAAAWAKRHEDFRDAVAFFRDQPPLPSPEQTFETLRRKALGVPGEEVPDFLTFRERHFAYIDRRTNCAVRAVSNWYQRDAVAQLEAHNRPGMILPPGMIKTTLFGIEYPVWRIFRDRNFRGTVVQKNASEAAKLIAAAKARLDHDHFHWFARRLEQQGDEPITCPVCVYCPDEPFRPDQKVRGAVWSQYAFRVLGITSGEKEPTMQAMGVESQLQGSRAEVILLDDIQSPQDALNSPASSASLLDYVRNTVLGRLYSEQKLVILANQITDDDFAARLVDAFPDWPTIRYPAILPCEDVDCPGDYEGCEHTEARVLCPEVWDFAGLMQKRTEVGEKVWWHQWELQSEGFDRRTFSREAMESARTEDYRLDEVPHAVTDFVIGVDPAAAASGYCAIVGWGLDNRGTDPGQKQRYLLSIFLESGMRTWSNVVTAIGAMASHLKANSSATFRAVVIEETNTQGTLIHDETLHRLIRGMGAQVITYKTRTGSGAQARRDSFNITTVAGLYDAGLVSLPYGGTVKEREAVDGFIEEHLRWRTDDAGRSIKHLRRDQVMASLFAESEAFKIANRPKIVRKPKRLDELPRFVGESQHARLQFAREKQREAFAKRFQKRTLDRGAQKPQEAGQDHKHVISRSRALRPS